MVSLPHEIEAAFQKLEQDPELKLEAVAQALYEFRRAKEALPMAVEEALVREAFAVTLCPDRIGDGGPWNRHFRPAFVSHDKEGVRTSHPLDLVTAETIGYWSARSREAGHPLLRARYADAAWELSPLIDGLKRDIENARVAIDSYVLVAAASDDTIVELRRALSLALAVHDAGRTEDVVQALFDLHNRLAKPRLIGITVFLFDSLFDLRKKLKLSHQRQKQLIADLEKSLLAVAGTADKGSLDHHAAQEYGERLLKFYRSEGSRGDIERVTRLFAGATERAAEMTMPMLAAAWLHDAHVAYFHAGLKDDADRVLIAVKEKGHASRGQMVSHVVSQTFTAEEVEGFLHEITAGGLRPSMFRIITFFLPKSVKLRERLANLRENYVMMSMLPMSLVDDDQVVARVGSVEGDEEGRLVHEIGEDMRFWSPFLARAIDRMFQDSDLAPEQFVDMLCGSPLFEPGRYWILKNGVRHYREGDHIAAIHVLVPQIEHALRWLLRALNRPTNFLKQKLDAYQEKDLGSVLADEALTKVLGEDVSRYLKALFTDQRSGWNIRNRVSHGLYASYFLNRQIADRVIHALMILSAVRPQSSEEHSE